MLYFSDTGSGQFLVPPAQTYKCNSCNDSELIYLTNSTSTLFWPGQAQILFHYLCVTSMKETAGSDYSPLTRYYIITLQVLMSTITLGYYRYMDSKDSIEWLSSPYPSSLSTLPVSCVIYVIINIDLYIKHRCTSSELQVVGRGWMVTREPPQWSSWSLV